jgi:putative ATP-dependent endonuclease of OLD family
MKIVSFTVSNYRSISTAYKLPLTDFSVIVGPNNEGKSNILKGLAIALSILSTSRLIKFRRSEHISFKFRKHRLNFDYEWPKNFPIKLQTIDPNGKTEFVLEFSLTESDLEDFQRKTKIKLTTNLKARIFIGKDDYEIDFLMRGRAKKALNKKSAEIVSFINQKTLVQYIPAIRTSSLAIDIVDNLLSTELSELEENPEFNQLINNITKLQKPILDRISKSLTTTIKGFIPDVKTVKIENRERITNVLSAACKVYINDGIETDLQAKGDGIISLTAISLLRHISQQSSSEKGLVLLLEEPESHLHPLAIHRLKSILTDISTTNQVIATTHSPIIVEKGTINHNIIVQKNRAAPAKNLAEIRDCLGIHMSDNLSSAYLILLVEGMEDKMVLGKWLTLKSKKLKEAFDKGVLVIDHLSGATNISYKTSLYKTNLCNIFAFLDNDNAGRKALEDALDKGTLKDNEYAICNCKGMANSELEDIFDLAHYQQLIVDEFGVDLNHKEFRNAKQAWSERVREVFRAYGKLWNDKTEKRLKESLANHISQKGLEVINPHKETAINALVTNLENIISKK